MKAHRYHILLALAHEPLHGAEIRRRVEEESHGVVTLYPAMLYGTLEDLQGSGWISEVDPDDLAPDQSRWRFYALTPEGRRALEGETGRLEAVLGAARAALGEARGG